MSKFQSTKVIELGSCAFRQWRATHSHCQYLHGYQLKAKLWFGGNELDDKNWIVDFGGLNDLKQHLKELFDHTTTVALDDPELETFKELDKKGLVQLRVFDDGVGIERVAEVVYERANDFVRHHTNDRCWVDKVEVFEHEDNSATYTGRCVSEWWFSKEARTDTQPLEQVDIKQTVPVEAPPVRDDKARPRKKPSSKTKGNWFKGTTWG